MRFHPWTREQIEETVAFAQANPPGWAFSPALSRRFLRDLTSSPELVFDLHDESGRAAIAVLIDRVSNPSNDASLEILGRRADVDRDGARAAFVSRAKARLPAAKAGFQVSLPEKDGADAMTKLGLQAYYDTCEMLRPDLLGVEQGVLAEIQPALKTDAEEIYRVLKNSFARNLDTNIPDFEEWRSGVHARPVWHLFLWRERHAVLGFAHMIPLDDGERVEINTVGVLPEARGRGIGRSLLNHCLIEALKLGRGSAKLSVAVENERALELYKRAGFAVTERYRCFRWRSDRSS